MKEQLEPKFSSKIRHFGYVRALGLFLVLFYHFYPKLLPGGFIGVDVFFTFSGYLITALIIEEFRVNKSFDVKKFAERRFFRIFPTLVFTMLMVLPLTFFGSSDLRFQLKQQVLAGLAFISNFFEAGTGISYENNFTPHIFVHLWSLAIEVQFYLFWALVVWLLVRYAGSAFIFIIFLLSFGFALFSMIGMSVLSINTQDYSSLYYSSLFHVFPFFIGSGFACIAGIQSKGVVKKYARKHTIKELIKSAVISASLIVGLSFLLRFNWKITYLFGFLLASLLTTALIFFLRILHEKTLKDEPKIIQIISDLSYGVYLFHWPFMVIFENLKLSHSLVVILTLILSFSLSAIMFYGIDPILRGKRRISVSFRNVLVGLASLLLIPAIMSLFLSTQQTELSRNLWEGANTQTVQTLYLSEKRVETGAFGADTLLIGDSVANGSRVSSYENAPVLETEIPNIFADTAGDRKISSDLESLLEADLALMPEGASIVIALGTNSTEPEKDIEILKKVITDYANHHIVLVTPANLGQGGPFNSDQIADWELSIDGKYENVTIADWRSVAAANPDYLDPDGIHIADRPEGREAWIGLVKAALEEK